MTQTLLKHRFIDGWTDGIQLKSGGTKSRNQGKNGKMETNDAAINEDLMSPWKRENVSTWQRDIEALFLKTN